MRFKEFDELHELRAGKKCNCQKPDGKPSDPGYYVKQKLGLIKTMSPESINEKLRRK